MSSDINGWSAISRCLKRQKNRQTDLAKLLDMSSSAISQAKSGLMQFNSTQLAQVAEYLEMDDLDLEEFYSIIGNARLLAPVSERRNSTTASRPLNLVPVSALTNMKTSLTNLFQYSPELESLSSFLSSKNINCNSGLITVNFTPEEQSSSEFTNIQNLTIAVDRYPCSGEIVLLFCRSGVSMLRRWVIGVHDQQFLPLLADHSPFSAISSEIRWMRPVTECMLKF